MFNEPLLGQQKGEAVKGGWDVATSLLPATISLDTGVVPDFPSPKIWDQIATSIPILPHVTIRILFPS